MRKRVYVGWVLFLLLACSAGIVSCGSKAAGPFDGSYTMGSISCNGQAADSNGAAFYISNGNSTTINISNATGSWVQTYGDSTCVATQQLAFTYSGSTITISPGSVSCTGTCPGSECPSAFLGGSPQFTATLNGLNSLTLATINGSYWCSGSTPAQSEPTDFNMSQH